MKRYSSEWEEDCLFRTQYEWSFAEEDYILVKREINPAYRGQEIVDPETGELVTEFKMSADEKKKFKFGKDGWHWFRDQKFEW